MPTKSYVKHMLIKACKKFAKHCRRHGIDLEVYEKYDVFDALLLMVDGDPATAPLADGGLAEAERAELNGIIDNLRERVDLLEGIAGDEEAGIPPRADAAAAGGGADVGAMQVEIRRLIEQTADLTAELEGCRRLNQQLMEEAQNGRAAGGSDTTAAIKKLEQDKSVLMRENKRMKEMILDKSDALTTRIKELEQQNTVFEKKTSVCHAVVGAYKVEDILRRGYEKLDAGAPLEEVTNQTANEALQALTQLQNIPIKEMALSLGYDPAQHGPYMPRFVETELKKLKSIEAKGVPSAPETTPTDIPAAGGGGATFTAKVDTETSPERPDSLKNVLMTIMASKTREVDQSVLDKYGRNAVITAVKDMGYQLMKRKDDTMFIGRAGLRSGAYDSSGFMSSESSEDEDMPLLGAWD